MEVVYSTHARQNIAERKISLNDIAETLSNPEEVLNTKKGRKIAQKTVGNRLLRIVYKDTGKVYIIVTAYYTRIGRY